MNTVEPGSDAVITVQFRQQGEPFLPTTPTWTLRGHSGAPVSGYIAQALTLPPTATSAQVTVPGAQNTIAVDRRFEIRRVVVSALRVGVAWQTVIPYRVIPYLNYDATVDDVRSFFGLDEGELPNGDVDLFAAYIAVEEAATRTVFETALVSGDRRQHQANNAIIAQAALLAIPALRQRLLLRHTDGSINAQRTPINWEALEGHARAQLNAALDVVGNRLAPVFGGFVAPALLDPITGA